jgi:diguanylate cyclase (GGDEF)-like protein
MSHDEHLTRPLEEARAWFHEAPGEAMAVALRVERSARAAGDRPGLVARALALQGMVTLHRGGLRQAFALAAEAAAYGRGVEDPWTVVEVAALEAHLAFFSGSYREALAAAERCVAAADRAGDDALALYARRCSCMVFANLGAPDWPERLDEMLALSVALGSAWEEAASHNDLANRALHELGDPAGASAELERALRAAERCAPRNAFVRGVVLCTRAEVALAAGDFAGALADARAGMASLEAVGGEGDLPNPYIYGMTVCVEVKALLGAERPEEAWRAGRAAVDRLGDSVPQARSMILADVAAALAAAGRGDDAYKALNESAELERSAYRELTELHRDFERAVIEQDAARREAEALSAKNRELEALQAQLREQAERDWLTGCYNRRYLASMLEELAEEHTPVSVAVLDLDHFKGVNDRFGHQVGDRVLARAAALLHENVRASDVVARAGGEEFVVVMPWTDAADAARCAERLRAAICADDWSVIAAGLEITTSIGLVTSDTVDVDAAVRLADKRLYAAKSAGRNRVDSTAA